MNNDFRRALELVLQEARSCSIDTNGFIQGLSGEHMALLLIEYENYRKKHGLKPLVRKRAVALPEYP